MSVLLEMIGRGWENFLARPDGPLSLRFYVQPTMASLLALRAGIQDAREGRQGYLWAILTRPERRLQLLHESWRGAMTPFLLAIALDGHLSAHDGPVCLPGGTAVHGDRAGAGPIRVTAGTVQSPGPAVLAGCSVAAAVEPAPNK